MKQSRGKIRSLFLISVLIIVSVSIISCENKIDSVPISSLINLPTVTGRDVETVFKDSGQLQLVMTTPLMEEYENSGSPYYEFMGGITVVFHDGHKEPIASVTSKYAKFTKSDNTWELKDSVVVVNESNDKLETEVLYWNQDKDHIYTDRFVKITNEDQVMQGFGFESDSHLRKRRIKKVSAIIYFNDEE